MAILGSNQVRVDGLLVVEDLLAAEAGERLLGMSLTIVMSSVLDAEKMFHQMNDVRPRQQTGDFSVLPLRQFGLRNMVKDLYSDI